MRRWFYLRFPLGAVALFCLAWVTGVFATPITNRPTPSQNGSHPVHLSKAVASATTPGNSSGLQSTAYAPRQYLNEEPGQALTADGNVGGRSLMGKTYGRTCTPRSTNFKTVAIMAMGFAGLVGAGRRWVQPSP